MLLYTRLTQTVIAKDLGITQQCLRLYLLGKRPPSLRVALAIDEKFSVPCKLWFEPPLLDKIPDA